jgi:hypothetical protein
MFHMVSPSIFSCSFMQLKSSKRQSFSYILNMPVLYGVKSLIYLVFLNKFYKYSVQSALPVFDDLPLAHFLWENIQGKMGYNSSCPSDALFYFEIRFDYVISTLTKFIPLLDFGFSSQFEPQLDQSTVLKSVFSFYAQNIGLFSSPKFLYL